MTGARQIVAGLESAGVTLAASVPDTWIGKLVEEVRRSSAIRVVDVAREEEAVAVAAAPTWRAAAAPCSSRTPAS
jgi:sulfopyruvate decarboxylase TPP-binding subunit